MLSCNLTVLDAFSSVRDYLRRVECEHQRLIHSVEDLPSSGPTATCTDTELLLLKATSQATLLCLEQCLAILHYQQQQPSKVFNSKGYLVNHTGVLNFIYYQILQQTKVNSATSSPLLGHTQKAIEVKKMMSEFPRYILVCQTNYYYYYVITNVLIYRLRSESAVSVLSDKTLTSGTFFPLIQFVNYPNSLILI